MHHTRTIRFFAPADMPEATAVRGFGLSQEFAPHVHRRYVLGLCEHGQRRIDYARQQVLATPGALFLIAPHTAHRCACSHEHAYRIVCFSPDLLPPDAGYAPLFQDQKLAAKILALHQALETGASLPQRRSLLNALLGGLRTRHARETAGVAQGERAAVQRVCRHLREHFAEKLTLETLAAAAGLSAGHLQRIFSKEIGVSPQAYLARHRVRVAALMLQQGHTHAETALACGFADQSHCIRVFKRYCGLSPERYLRQNKGQGLP